MSGAGDVIGEMALSYRHCSGDSESQRCRASLTDIKIITIFQFNATISAGNKSLESQILVVL